MKCPRSFPFSFHNTIPVLATQAPNTADSVSLVLCILSSPFSRLLSSYIIIRAFQLFFFHMLFLSRYSSPNRLSPSCYWWRYFSLCPVHPGCVPFPKPYTTTSSQPSSLCIFTFFHSHLYTSFTLIYTRHSFSFTLPESSFAFLNTFLKCYPSFKTLVQVSLIPGSFPNFLLL